MKLIEKINHLQINETLPKFKAGDFLAVHEKITEGKKTRIQVFKGICIKKTNPKLISCSFTIRKKTDKIPIEKTFKLHSPLIKKIDVLKIGKTRRAKLYYLRNRVGKSEKIKYKPNKK